MLIEVIEGLYSFMWDNNRENNCNAFLIDGSRKILIDPGHQHLFAHVEKGLAALKIPIEKIDLVIATHAHPDHFEAVARFPDTTQFAMGYYEYELVKKFAGSYFQLPEPDFFLQEGELIIGTNQFEILETPGHSPGSVCIYWPEKRVLFAGDVIFHHGIGRTDLPGGSGKQLKESIQRIRSLDVEYVLSGHGDVIAGKEAVQANFQEIENYWFNYI